MSQSEIPMSHSDIVSPKEAQSWWGDLQMSIYELPSFAQLFKTVATEPGRIRAAVVKALLPIRRYAEAGAISERAMGHQQAERAWLDLLILIDQAESADAIEDGADYI